jgi:transcription antitermination factor NusG
LALLDVWATLDFPDERTAEDTLDVFKKIAINQALLEEKDETWAPAQAGFMLKVGDEVRVRHNAFTGAEARIHNGRRGRILAIRSGDIIVRTTDDKTPFLDGAHYAFTDLEKRIR